MNTGLVKFTLYSILTVQSENMTLGICRQQRPRSACPYVLSDQGFHCPLTETLDTTECINVEQMLGFFFFFFDLGFTTLSRVFHLYRADRSSKVGKNWRTLGKTT